MSPKAKTLVGFGAVALLLLILFNAVIVPALNRMSVQETDYGTFLTMVEEGKVDQVQLQSNKILFTEKVAEGERPRVYMTGYVENPDLAKQLHEAQVVFGGEIPNESSPLLMLLLTWILPIGVLMILGSFLTKKMEKRMGGNALTLGKSNAKVYVEAQTGKTFNDVAGQDEAKQSLMEIVDFLHNPEKYSRIGARMPKGVLLVGPPGTGKTLLAKAVAGESGVPFFSISGSDFVEMFVGMGAARVRDLFKEAAEKAPCIVFIDEIDTIGKTRDNAAGIGGNDEREQTLNQLLSEMDGFDASKGVVILAATNRPEVLDKALMRPGRFDRRVPVDLPDLNGRIAILKVHMRQVQAEPNINLAAVARTSPGASGADLANIINEAALLAVKAGRSRVTQGDMDEAVETVIAGQQRKGAVISDEERRIIAAHEVGHALVAALSGNRSPVHKITIIPRTSGALGFTLQVPESENVLVSKAEALDRITTCLGGRAAEEICFNSITSGASNDIEQATKLARAMVTRLGMSESFDMMALETVNSPYLGGDASLACAPETASRADAEVLGIIRDCHERAKELIRRNTKRLSAIAARLLEVESMSGEEFSAMLQEIPEG